MTFGDLLLQQTINGLSLGAMYALLALWLLLASYCYWRGSRVLLEDRAERAWPWWLGFAASETARLRAEGQVDERLTEKITLAGVEAARRKFTPEFKAQAVKRVLAGHAVTLEMEVAFVARQIITRMFHKPVEMPLMRR